MKKKLSKNWFLAIIFAPFFLMICFHIGLALGAYSGINFNADDISTKDWFMFAGSYLGGVMTLIGVTITIRQERRNQRYEDSLSNIEREREHLGAAISGINTIIPKTIYQRYINLPVTPEGYNSSDVSSIIQSIDQERETINKIRMEAIFFTDIYDSASCKICNNVCSLKEIRLEFQKIYDEIAKQLFDIYLKIEKYITVNEGNIVNKKMVANFRQMNKILLEEGKPPMYDELAIKEYESRIIDIQPMQGEILQILKEICDLNQREIVQLTGLAKGYIAVKRQNAEKTCYPKT